MKGHIAFLALMGATVVALAACNSAEEAGPRSTTATDAPDATQKSGSPDTGEGGGEGSNTTSALLIGEGIEIGMAFDVGGRGDRGFNDLAAKAWDAGKRTHGYIGRELVPTDDPASKGENLLRLARTGHDMIIANGFAFAQDVWRVGTDFPDVVFAITGDCPQDDNFEVVDMDNVRCMLFAEEEGSFLVGAAAALKSTTDTIGFIGGVEVSLIKKFQAGFEAGARHVNPNITILPAAYLTQLPDFSGFSDPAKANEAALALYEQGVDVIYYYPDLLSSGVLEAADAVSADDRHVWAIGVDFDQYSAVAASDPELAEHVLTSMLKNLDIAVGRAILDFLEGNLTAGPLRLGLADGGIGYSTSGGFVDDIADELDALAEKIVDGTIEVPIEPNS